MAWYLGPLPSAISRWDVILCGAERMGGTVRNPGVSQNQCLLRVRGAACIFSMFFSGCKNHIST